MVEAIGNYEWIGWHKTVVEGSKDRTGKSSLTPIQCYQHPYLDACLTYVICKYK